MTPRRNRAATLAIALAGIAPAALAQPTLRFTADTTDPGSLGTVNWTVSVTGITSPGAYLQAYDLDILASVAVGSSSFTVTTPFATALTPLVNPTPGTPSNGSILGVSGGQTTLLDPLGTVFGDVVLGTFSVTSAGPQLGLTYDVADGGLLGSHYIRFRDNSFGPPLFDGRPNVVSDIVNFTPTPGAAGVLAGAAIVFTRRRRA